MKTALCDLLGIKYPIIQGGMIWVSGAKLAAAVSNAGGLGIIGAGSMKPNLLREQIIKAQSLTDSPFGINLPIMYKDSKEQIDVALELGVKIFITSAGSPKKFTSYLKEKNCIVMHVTSTPELAKKCEAAGVDAVIVEGFEAGGHNGRDEITTMVLVPQCKLAVNIPVVAAGGIATGSAIVAAMALGAQGVQIGTRFLMSHESRAHQNFKEALTHSTSSSTKLMLKKHVPVRLFKNQFYSEIESLEIEGASKEVLIEHLGKGRAMKGMHNGELETGELEAGQVCALTTDILSVEQIMKNLIEQYKEVKSSLP